MANAPLTAVYDTNVIVSATLKARSIPAFVVALAMRQQVQLYVSEPIWNEYDAAHYRAKFRLDPEAVALFPKELQQSATVVVPTQRLTAAVQESDNRFLECAATARATYIVTGNTRHFPSREFEGTRIVSPAEFARCVTEQQT